MKIYFAITDNEEKHFMIDGGYTDLLMSYHYFKKKRDDFSRIKSKGGNIFMDSGAFSSHSIGASIDIDAYSAYLIEMQPAIYVSLDVIGDPEQTYRNWEYQNSRYALNCMPTFHIGEPIEYLDRYISQCDYIALGGMVGHPNPMPWLDRVWSHIIRTKPELKVHGFGMTTVDLIYKYPWFSFDSTTYKVGVRFGQVPQFNGKTLYRENIRKIFRRLEQNGHPDIWHDKPKQRRLATYEGADAFLAMVKYLNSFERKFDFVNQGTLF